MSSLLLPLRRAAAVCPLWIFTSCLSRRILCTLLLSCVVTAYVTFWLQTVLTFTEVIPFQKDLKLFTRNVYIDGELEAYNLNITNFTVDCKAFKKKHQKSTNFVYVAVLTSNKSIHTLAKAVYNTWGAEADKIEFFIGNGSTIDSNQLPVVQLNCK